MRNAGGQVIITDPYGPTVEHDTFTCGHCNKIKIVKPKERPEDIGGLCKVCMKLICGDCVSTGTCDPLEEKLKREEASYHARRSYAG